MTIDQCLSCTRYEPILGQIYAIFDETGSNVNRVLDDMQMSYMSMDDYIAFTRTEEIHDEKNMANLKKNSDKIPDAFEKTFDEGFKMDWNKTDIDIQKVSVLEYETEKKEEEKKEEEKKEQQEDKLNNNIVNEDNTVAGDINNKNKEKSNNEEESSDDNNLLEFSTEDYVFEDFGRECLSSYGFGGGDIGSAIRQKIVDYAENALSMCQQGRAGYSQDLRYSHLENAASNGISYWDCSSLVSSAYASAGITNIGSTTSDEYPYDLPAKGGLIFLSSQLSEAIPGDCVWFTKYEKPKDANGLNTFNVQLIHHTAIYVGDGKIIEAAGAKGKKLEEQIIKSDLTNRSTFFAFGRPKALVEADKKVLEGGEYDGPIPTPNFTFVGMNEKIKKNLIDISERAIRNSLKTPTLLPSSCITQAGVESGWGQNIEGNNYFGISAPSGYTGKTFKNSSGITLKTYDSLYASVDDYYNNMYATSCYKQGGVFDTTDPMEQIKRINDSGYCGGEQYIILSKQLYKEQNIEDANRVFHDLQKKIANSKNSSYSGFDYLLKLNVNSYTFNDMRKNASTSTMNSIKSAAKSAGKQYGIDPLFVIAIINHESGFNPKAHAATSTATGLMQILSSNFPYCGITDGYNIQQNITGGTRLLKENIKQFENKYPQTKALLGMIGYAIGANFVFNNNITDWDSYQKYLNGNPTYKAETRAVGEIIKGYQIFSSDKSFSSYFK